MDRGLFREGEPRQSSPPKMGAICHTAYEVACGMAALHAQNVVHGGVVAHPLTLYQVVTLVHVFWICARLSYATYVAEGNTPRRVRLCPRGGDVSSVVFLLEDPQQLSFLQTLNRTHGQKQNG